MKYKIYLRWIARSFFLTALCFPNLYATCLKNKADRYTADVRSKLDPTLDEALAGAADGNPLAADAAAAIASAIAGTEAGELIDFGIAKWWDPTKEVFPNNPNNIVTPIPDSAILAIANSILNDVAGPSITLSSLNNLNSQAPGMGTAAVTLLTTGTRAFAQVLQGAAAYAANGAGSASVLAAANLTNADLAAYRSALLAYAPYLDLLPFAGSGLSSIPQFTVSDYLNFISSVQTDGASALPQGEVAYATQVLSLANVHLLNTNFTDDLVSDISAGDTSDEAALFPSGGFTASGLLESGPSNSFDVNCKTCSIAVPEASSNRIMIIGAFALIGCSCWKIKKRRQFPL